MSARTVTWIEATHGDPVLAPLWAFLAERVALDAGGRVTTRLQHVGVDAGGIRTPANRLLSDAGVVAAALVAEPTSDGIVVGCWGGPTAAVRSAVRVPATTLTDASVRAVGSLARRAVVVTVATSLTPIFAADLDAHGATSMLPTGPVRAYDPESSHADVVAAIADPAALVDRFDRVAQQAVTDGADAIVVGCGYLAPIFTAHGYASVLGHPDVPVLDCNRIALEHVIHLMDLVDAGIAPTRRGHVRPEAVRADRLRDAAARLDRRIATTPDEGTPA